MVKSCREGDGREREREGRGGVAGARFVTTAGAQTAMEALLEIEPDK